MSQQVYVSIGCVFPLDGDNGRAGLFIACSNACIARTFSSLSVVERRRIGNPETSRTWFFITSL